VLIELADRAMWREFGLRNALAHMPADSPGRAVVQSLLDSEMRPRDAEASGGMDEVSSRRAASGTNGSDVLDSLERLAALREMG